MTIYSSRSDFNTYCSTNDVSFNYTEMKTEMLNGLSNVEAANCTDVSDIDVNS